MTTRSLPVGSLHHRAVSAFDDVVAKVANDQWALPTPCPAWDVRALVNHVVGETRWTGPLLTGLSVADVGSRLDGDLLGSDPLAAWRSGRDGAVRAADTPRLGSRVVHLAAGETPAEEYLRQLTADYLVHTWDLAVAIGADDDLDPVLVDSVGTWFATAAADYRAAGAVAAPVPVADGDGPQRRLLASFGRDPEQSVTRAAVARFAAAFDRSDIDAVMAAMTGDCAFESTAPPDGRRHAGQSAVRAAWTEFFAGSAGAVFETEEEIVSGDRVVARWRYAWPGGHVRGVDVYRVRDRLVAEKLSYVKG
jgi:uncharacterized protein (TIGR03086 family)